MGDLKAFMLPSVEDTTKEIKVSNRFTEPFVIRVISQETNESLRKKASRPIRKNGTTVGEDFDTVLYGKLLLQACVASPNFKATELCNYYKTQDPLEVPGRMLTAGEYGKLIKEINILNGFTDDPEVLADEAKNS